MSSGQAISEFIRQLDIACKSMSMYSENHPSARAALDEAFALLQEPLQTRSSVTLSIIGSDILMDGEPAKRGDRAIERFVKTLDTRDVRSLTFFSTVTRDELVGTLRLLNNTPQRIRESGGMESLFQKEGIAGIQANKVRYGIIGEGNATGVSVAVSVDEGLLSNLMAAVQGTGVVGSSDSAAAAQDVERTLEDSGTPDTSAALFQIFQQMAQGTLESTKPLRERFLEMFRSFSPKMQGKLLLTAILNHAVLEKSSLNGFYHELRPEELESPIVAILMLEQNSEHDLRNFAETLAKDAQFVLPESVRSKFVQRGLLPAPPPPVEDLSKKAVLDAGDYPRVLDLLRKDLVLGNLEAADKLSKRILAGMTVSQPDQRAAAVRVLPMMVQELLSNEKWKNVETSLSFLLQNQFRKETDAGVLEAYAAFIGTSFRKKFEQRDLAGCKELLSLAASKTEHGSAIANGLATSLPDLREAFKRELKETGPVSDLAMEYLRAARAGGADFLLEWLAEEEDQRVRSRIISHAERLDREHLLPEMEKRLSDPRWYVVRNMVTICGRLNLPTSVSFMSRAMQDPDIRVAKEVVKALFKSVTSSNAPLVMELLQHSDKSIRLQALRLVTLFGIEKGDARSILQKMASTDPVPEVRTLASSILG